ncbi:hypothetical protein [Aerosakkonema sp. BLCC-F183]|uniref:hypothetical protein n=2 Tax=Aerosakkonema TaxID=1246629 RepID=UPI0035BC5053
MGIVRMGPPNDLVAQLGAEFRIINFVETGTAYGGTALWASQQFKNVFTVEYCQEIYEQTVKNFHHIENIEFRFGDSRTELTKIVTRLESASFFWLDAHWSGGITYGENDECPLLEEIDIINKSEFENFILIDDARLFTSPPMPPHRIEQWPDITAVLNALHSGRSDRYIIIIEDVIIAVPQSAKPTVSHYCQEVNAKAWVEFDKQVNTPNYIKGINLIYLDIKQRLRLIERIKRRVSQIIKN